jgi:hypothetical protein
MISINTLKDRMSIHDDMRTVFDSPQGQRVLRHLIRTQGVTAPAHQRGNTCCDTAQQDGRRAVVMDIIHFINVDPAYFNQLLDQAEQENQNAS